jgi:hypothetical protein
MRSMRNFILLAAAGFAAALAADPALAQSADGGGDARFGQGMGAVLNWAFGAGVAAALFTLFSFPPACVFLFMRNRPPRPQTRPPTGCRGFPD